jgi:hypothetical protein
MRRIAITAAVALAAVPASAGAASKIVLHGTLRGVDGLTAHYVSTHGKYSATWVKRRHYRISGRINGKRLKGSIVTRQNSAGTSYRGHGTGTLGGRTVHISASGPTSLSRSTVVLR